MNKFFRYLISMLSFALIVQVANAQSEPDTNGYVLSDGQTYQQLFDSITSGLIQSRIPYGILYDRVLGQHYPFDWHNGDTVSKYSLFQDWWDMEHSRVATNAEGTYDAMRRGADTQSLRNRMPLLYINYNLAYFDTGALTDGRLSIVDGIYTDNNLTQSPYRTATKRSIGLPMDEAYAGTAYTLMLDTAHYSLSNNGRRIQSVTVTDITANREIDLLPGGEGALLFEEASDGLHQLSIVALLDDATYLTVIQFIRVRPVGRNTGTGLFCSPVHGLVESDIPFQGYGESYPTTGWGDYHIYYHNASPNSNDCEQVLRKPIIVLDGYDPQDGRPYSEIYKEYLSYGPIGSTSSAADEIRQQGYDIIVLNFPRVGSQIPDVPISDPASQIPAYVRRPYGGSTLIDYSYIGRDGGTDYIERNAFVLVKLIQQVNTWLATNGSSQKVVVVGPSMGGQISRYALAYMEKQYANGNTSMNPNTRLWVSFDSPHWGANIPLATQRTLYWFGYNAGKQDAKDAYDQELHCPAGRQLLIEQLAGQNNTEPGRQQYIYNLDNNGLSGSHGWPSYDAPGGNIRKIALVNGSGAGVRDYTEGQQMLSGTGFSAGLKVFELNTYFLKAPGQTDKYFEARSTSPITSSIFGFGWHASGIHITRSGAYSTTNSNQNGCMDVVPGGYYPSTQTVKDRFETVLASSTSTHSWTVVVPTHTFIPTISALGFINPYYVSGTTIRNWNTRVDDRNLICSNEIPFDNYFLPKTNQQHITLTSDNVAWLKDEIYKGEQHSGCPQICTDNWPSTICDQSTVRLNLSGMPSNASSLGYTVTWDAPINPGGWPTSNISFSNQALDHTDVTANVTHSTNTNNTVTATIHTPCGADYTISKTFTIPTIFGLTPGITVNSTPTAGRWSVQVSFPAPPAGVSTSWGVTYWNRPMLHTGASGTNAGTATSVRNTGDTILWGVNASEANGCGDDFWGGAWKIVSTNGSGGATVIPGLMPLRASHHNDDNSLAVAPNPADNSWGFHFNNATHSPVAISISDLTGKQLFNIIPENKQQLDIPCGKLASGLYIATVQYDDGSKESVRLQRE